MSSGEGWDVIVVAWPSPLLDQAAELRFRVLHEPFRVPRDDCWNDDDPASVHVMVLEDGRVAGYARLIVAPDALSGQIRQVSVDPGFECRGIGSSLVGALIEEAHGRGLHVWLNARVTALPFYERLGFVVTSEEFRAPRTYVPHRRMDLAP